MNTATKTIKVYDEIVDFIASGTTPQSVIDFHLSEAAQERLEDLIYNAKNNALTKEDKRELDHFLTIEHILILAKAKAHRYINTEAK
jgi:DNA-binding protein YbaB